MLGYLKYFIHSKIKNHEIKINYEYPMFAEKS